MERILRAVYENKKLFRILRAISHLTSGFAFVLFCFITLRTLISSPIAALKLTAIIGGAYVVVSLARWLIDAPRPYEIYGFYDTPPKNRKGLSFPSRHSFLVFAIATVAAPTAPISAAFLAILGVLLAASRVLSGIHFIKDVTVGALSGIISSIIGLLILFPY